MMGSVRVFKYNFYFDILHLQECTLVNLANYDPNLIKVFYILHSFNQCNTYVLNGSWVEKNMNTYQCASVGFLCSTLNSQLSR